MTIKIPEAIVDKEHIEIILYRRRHLAEIALYEEKLSVKARRANEESRRQLRRGPSA